MKSLLRPILRFPVLAASCLSLAAVHALEDPPEPLGIEETHPAISRSISTLLEELHYSQRRLDNSISTAVLDSYLDALDGDRMFFLASDVASFGRYRYELDDRARSGDLEPAFAIFNLFRERARERFEYALRLLETEPDFTLDETFVFDRSELPWPASNDEMNEVWRRKVKSDALSLVLAEKPWPEVVETLRTRYERSYGQIADLTSDDVLESFMSALAHTLDPHSRYLSSHRTEEYRIDLSLSYEGIGARLTTDGEHVEVLEILPGGPAHLDGRLKQGDRIVAVGQSTKEELTDVVGWRLDQVVRLIRGPRGTTVRLSVLPAGAAPGSQQKMLSLVREKVKDEERAAKSQVIDVPLDGKSYKVGVIEVRSFYQDLARRGNDEDYASTSRDVERLLREIEAEGVAGIVMDLRQNGGGHLSEATALSGLFIDAGPLVQLRETGGRVSVLEDPYPGRAFAGPLAVLVDRQSASASEIFAAAMQDYGRGVIVGQTTFGKGSVQSGFDLNRVVRGDDTGTLMLTIGKYYRVTGDSTQNRGVAPDIELPPLFATDTIGESAQETALPWDRIKAARYKPESALGPAIASLREHYARWSAEDPDFEYLREYIAELEEARAQTSVSLNLAQRKAERDGAEAEQLALENARRAARGLEPLASLTDLEPENTPRRIQLEIAARVVADLARLEG